MTKRFAALKKAKEEDGFFPSDYRASDEPKCPHCGHVCHVSDNEWWDLYEEGEHEKECPSCEGKFTVSTRVSYSFSTDEQEDMDDEGGGNG